MTIQSRSPRRRLASASTFTCRADAIAVAASPIVDTRVDGRGGSCSRIVRISSSKPDSRIWRMSKSLAPVNSS